jgi:hypothetical protein
MPIVMNAIPMNRNAVKARGRFFLLLMV